MTIVIIGADDDSHSLYMKQVLNERGHKTVYLDTRLFPEWTRIAMYPTSNGLENDCLILPIDEHDGPLYMRDIETVYWRFHQGIRLPSKVDAQVGGLVYRELESALGSMFRNYPNIRWINSATAIERHRYKPHQLFLLANAGIRVPDTLISNDPVSLRAFFEKHHGQVIYKPVAGGAHTCKLTEDDFEPARMKELQTCPVQFQEMIEGVDIRVYLIGERLFAAEIQSETLDFRDHPGAPIVPIEIPDWLQDQCRTLACLFEYHFTGIDIRRTPEGEYVMIEGNPSPMFTYFEEVTGFPLTDCMVELLTTGECRA